MAGICAHRTADVDVMRTWQTVALDASAPAEAASGTTAVRVIAVETDRRERRCSRLATLDSPVLQTVHRGGFGHHHLRFAEMLRLPLLLLGSDLCLHIGSEMSAAADDALTISQPLGAVGRQCGIDIVVARQGI